MGKNRGVPEYSSEGLAFLGVLFVLFLVVSCGGKSHPNRINSITLSPLSASISVNGTEQFNATATQNDGQVITGDNSACTWTSSNTTVATVNGSGMATGLAAGTTTITASYQTGGGLVSGSASLTVTAPTLVSINVTPSNQSISTSQQQQFAATGIYSDNSQQTLASPSWNSSNTAVATISNTGLATATTTSGTTIITATDTASGINGDTTLAVTAAGQTINSYVGTQSPGELWLLSVNDTALTFSANNESASLSYAGTLTALPNGFYETTLTSSNDSNLPVGTSGYAIEVPGLALVISIGGGTDKPVAAIVPGQCPAITSTLTAYLINIGKSTYDSTTSESYATVAATQSGSNYDFTVQSYLLDGTLRSQSGALPSGTCSNGVITVPNVSTDDGGVATVTAIATANGLYVLDLGRDSVTNTGRGGAVGTTTQQDPSQISSAMAVDYLGLLYKRNSTPITTFVGFGPGSGTSITGGTFADQDTDGFNAHANDITITLQSTANSNGFLQGQVTDSNGTHTPFVAIITNSGGYYFLFGITTDTSNTTPYAIMLAQTTQ